MKNKTLFRLGIFFLVFLEGLCFPGSGYANPTSDIPPEGFLLIRASIGVQLYRKDFVKGTPDYVQIIKLNRGAEIQLLHGDMILSNAQPGVFGGLDARFNSRSIKQYWQEIYSLSERSFCVSNGEFFNMYEYPTRLPFPLKVDGQILSGGYSKGEFTDEKMMLEIWLDQVNIRPLTKSNFQQSSAPNILSGLFEASKKSPDKYVGRTFVGVEDEEGDGVYETLLIFSTQSARQVDAAQTLRDFGGEKVMMLDGGLSTQLVCQGRSYIETDRLIPTALAVLDGTQPYFPKLNPQPYPPKPGFQEAAIEPMQPQSIENPDDNSVTILEKTTDQPKTGNLMAISEEIHYTDALFIPLLITTISVFLYWGFRRI